MSLTPSTKASRKRAYSTLCDTMDDCIRQVKQSAQHLEPQMALLEKSMMNVHYVFKENDVMHEFVDRVRVRDAQQKAKMEALKKEKEELEKTLLKEGLLSEKLREQKAELTKQNEFLSDLVGNFQRREIRLYERIAFLENNEKKWPLVRSEGYARMREKENRERRLISELVRTRKELNSLVRSIGMVQTDIMDMSCELDKVREELKDTQEELQLVKEGKFEKLALTRSVFERGLQAMTNQSILEALYPAKGSRLNVDEVMAKHFKDVPYEEVDKCLVQMYAVEDMGQDGIPTPSVDSWGKWIFHTKDEVHLERGIKRRMLEKAKLTV